MGVAMRPVAVVLVVTLAVAACGGTAEPTVKPASPTPVGSCSIPPRTYADLVACSGTSDPFDLQVADSFDGKTVARIAVNSRNPEEILRALGVVAREWSAGADSFSAWAYSSEKDYNEGAPFNRGMIFWNDGGEITLTICTDWEKVGGIDSCTESVDYAVKNK